MSKRLRALLGCAALVVASAAVVSPASPASAVTTTVHVAVTCADPQNRTDQGPWSWIATDGSYASAMWTKAGPAEWDAAHVKGRSVTWHLQAGCHAANFVTNRWSTSDYCAYVTVWNIVNDWYC